MRHAIKQWVVVVMLMQNLVYGGDKDSTNSRSANARSSWYQRLFDRCSEHPFATGVCVGTACLLGCISWREFVQQVREGRFKDGAGYSSPSIKQVLGQASVTGVVVSSGAGAVVGSRAWSRRLDHNDARISKKMADAAKESNVLASDTEALGREIDVLATQTKAAAKQTEELLERTTTLTKSTTDVTQTGTALVKAGRRNRHGLRKLSKGANGLKEGVAGLADQSRASGEEVGRTVTAWCGLQRLYRDGAKEQKGILAMILADQAGVRAGQVTVSDALEASGVSIEQATNTAETMKGELADLGKRADAVSVISQQNLVTVTGIFGGGPGTGETE